MKRILSIFLLLGGVGTLLLGMLFIIGAGGQAHRYVVGLVGLGAGVAAIGFGIRWFRAAEADSPEQVLADLLEAARRKSGEISELELVAALGKRARLAPKILERLVAEGLCERRRRDEATYYVFRDLQPRLFVRRCQFCGAEQSIASDATKCPRCGGAVASAVERRALSDGAYRMDE